MRRRGAPEASASQVSHIPFRFDPSKSRGFAGDVLQSARRTCQTWSGHNCSRFPPGRDFPGLPSRVGRPSAVKWEVTKCVFLQVWLGGVSGGPHWKREVADLPNRCGGAALYRYQLFWEGLSGFPCCPPSHPFRCLLVSSRGGDPPLPWRHPGGPQGP